MAVEHEGLPLRPFSLTCRLHVGIVSLTQDELVIPSTKRIAEETHWLEVNVTLAEETTRVRVPNRQLCCEVNGM